MPSQLNRRDFLVSSTALTATTALTGCQAFSSKKLKLGFDNFSIRAMKLKATAILDFGAKHNVDAILFSDLDVYESLEESYLKELKAKADELKIEIHAGTGSICPSSKAFRKKHGTAEEHLKKALKVSKILGSPVVRCYLGSRQDRLSPGGLKPHMDATIKVCKSVESEAKDAGIKIAIENHAGDMTGRLLRELIEKAGPDYVGATIDSGNATWTMETPYKNLDLLAPYVACSGIRDSLVFDTKQGVNATWKAMGDGTVDWNLYFQKWQKSCPEVPIFLETISGLGKTFPPPSDKEFWIDYQDINMNDYLEFKTMTAKGNNKKITSKHKDLDKKILFSPEYMKQELVKSLNYCKDTLNIGRNA